MLGSPVRARFFSLFSFIFNKMKKKEKKIKGRGGLFFLKDIVGGRGCPASCRLKARSRKLRRAIFVPLCFVCACLSLPCVSVCGGLVVVWVLCGCVCRRLSFGLRRRGVAQARPRHISEAGTPRARGGKVGNLGFLFV